MTREDYKYTTTHSHASNAKLSILETLNIRSNPNKASNLSIEQTNIQSKPHVETI